MAKGVPLMGRDPDGKAKIINVDENGNVKVQLSGTIGSHLIHEVRGNAQLAPKDEITVIDIDNPFIIDSLQWRTDHPSRITLRLLYRKNSTLTSEFAVLDRSVYRGILSMNSISNAGHPAFSIVSFDSENNFYKVETRDKLIFPEGGKIIVNNNSSEDTYTSGWVILGREFQ